MSSSSISHSLPTRRNKLMKKVSSFKIPKLCILKNRFTFLNTKKCFQNGENCWDFLAKPLQHSSEKRKELHFKNKSYKSTLFLACVINTISYSIHFKDALAQVFIPLRAHISAQIILLVLWNSECPVWFICWCGGYFLYFFFFFFMGEGKLCHEV